MSNSIGNILKTVEDNTSFRHGHLSGHIISKAQIAAIRKELSKFKVTIEPPTPKALTAPTELLLDIQILRESIQVRREQLAKLDASERSILNLEIQQDESELNRLNRALINLRV